jgi:quinol monooxygenase YgiN
MNVFPEKRIELSQTIHSLSVSTRLQKGCRRWNFCQSVEDENILFLLEEWDNQKDLMTHMKSDNFKVIRGTRNVLQEPYETMFYTVSHPTGVEEILIDGTT